MPPALADFELLPSIWRTPAKVGKAAYNRDLLTLDTLDGGVLNLVVDPDLGIIQFYKLLKKGRP